MRKSFMGLLIIIFLTVTMLTPISSMAAVLAHDDGTSESSVSPQTEEVGSEIAVKFAPLSYPSSLGKW